MARDSTGFFWDNSSGSFGEFVKVWSLTKPSGTQISCYSLNMLKMDATPQLLSMSTVTVVKRSPRKEPHARWSCKIRSAVISEKNTTIHFEILDCFPLYHYLEIFGIFWNIKKNKMINYNKLSYLEISYLFQDTSSLIIPIILWAKHGGRFSPIYSITSCRLFVRGFWGRKPPGNDHISHPRSPPVWWVMLCTRSLGENMFALKIWQNQR